MNLKLTASKIEDASFNRLKSKLENEDFAIITAYRPVDKDGNRLTKKDNIQRNRILRGKLNELHWGVYELIGHWLETPSNQTFEEAKAMGGVVVDVTERSYVVVRPKDVPEEVFESTMKSLMTVDGLTQEAIILKDSKGIRIYYRTGREEPLGSLSWNKISQSYSQSVLRQDKPFVFDGVMCPDSITGRLFMRRTGLSWI